MSTLYQRSAADASVILCQPTATINNKSAQQNSPALFMRWIFALLMLVTISVKGQVSSSTFAPTSGTYTGITGGTVLGTITNDEQVFFDATGTTSFTNGVANGTGFPIGFNFTYNGVSYDHFAVNTNGFIVLGNGTFSIMGSAGGLTDPISNSTTGVNNIISAMTFDQQGQTTTSTGTRTNGSASVTAVTAGTAAVGMTVTGTGIQANTFVTAVSGTTITLSLAATTNSSTTLTFSSTIQFKNPTASTLAVQWAGYRDFSATGDFFNYQIILTQTTNVVQFVYGTNVASPTSNANAYPAQVGLRGTTTADFKNRAVGNGIAWASSTAGGTNAAICKLRDNQVPASGLTYTFTPPPVAPTLTAAVGATVDANFNITFTDDLTWRGLVTLVKYGTTTLTLTTDYTLTAGVLTLKPGGGNVALQTAGTQTVSITATGYSNATVSQPIGFGAANKLLMVTQPVGPTTNGAVFATPPVVKVTDQYGNTVTNSVLSVTANAVAGSGAWTVSTGATNPKAAVAGIATFTALTATSACAVTGAAINFTASGVTAISSTTFSIVAPAAPTLTAAVGATVDANFNITFSDDPTWRAAITSITYGASTLTSPTDYSITAGVLTLKPGGGNIALQTSGTQTLAIAATCYVSTTVSQGIAAGAANKLLVTTQPAAPASNGAVLGTQPVVRIADQYGNTTTSTLSVTANAVAGSAAWTVSTGATNPKAAVAGVATFTALTATSAVAVTGATINFTATGVTSVASAAFNIPPPPPTWVGNTSNDWNTASNWSNSAVPTSSDNVTIATGGANQPTISVAAACNNITLNTGTTLTINAGLAVGGNWTNNGGSVPTSSTGTVTLSNATSATIGGSASTTFPNLTITGLVVQAINTNVNLNFSQSGVGSIYVVSSLATALTLSITGDYSLTAGQFQVAGTSATAAGTVTVGGNATINTTGTAGIYLQTNSGSSAAGIFQVAGNADFQGSSTRWINFGSGTNTTCEFRIGKNFSATGSGNFYTSSSTASKGIVFNGAGTLVTPQTFTYSSSVNSDYTEYLVNTGTVVQMLTGLSMSPSTNGTNPVSSFTVNGTLDAKTFTITGGASQIFALSPGATLATANINGIRSAAIGSISTTISTAASFNAGANYIFNGAANQATAFGNTSMANLTINNTGTAPTHKVTLTTAGITVSGTLAVDNGIFDAAALQIVGNATGNLTVGSGDTLRLGGTTTFPTLFTAAHIALNATSAVEYYGTTQTVSNTPTTYGHLVITTTGVKTAGGALTMAGNVAINSGTFAGSTFTHNVGGNWSNAGTYTAGSSTVNFNGANAATVSGTTAFSTVTINKGAGATIVDFTGTSTVGSAVSVTTGFMRIQSGASFTSSGTVTVASTGNIHVNGGTFSLTGASVANDGLFRITTGTANIGSATGNALDNTGNATVDVQGGILNVSGRLRLNSSIMTVSGGTINLGTVGLSNASRAVLEMDGASAFTMTSGTPLITFQNFNSGAGGDLRIASGAGSKSVTAGAIQFGNASTPAAATFQCNSAIPLYNVTINNTNAPKVALAAVALTINNQLAMNGGTFNLGAFNLFLGATAPAISTSGTFSATNMIIADGGGAVVKFVTADNSYTFPMGDNTGTPEYSPITLAYSGTTYAGNALIGTSVTNLKHTDNHSTTNFLNRYWSVLQTGITGSPTVSVSASYVAADIAGTEGLIKAAQLKGTFNAATNPWVKYSTLAGNTLTAGGAPLVAGQTDAFTGITSADPTVGITGTTTICNGQSTTLTAAGVGDGAFTYVWSNGSLVASSGTLSPTTNTTYSVTATDANGITAINSQLVTVKPVYTITASVISGSGTISPLGVTSVCENSDGPTYTISPVSCYQADVVIDGVTHLGNISSYSGFTNVTANHTIDVTFTIIPYTITITQATGGTIALASGDTDCGSTPGYTATADDCHTLNHIDVDGGNVGGSPYTFAALSGNHTITAVYDIIPYTITITQATGGTIALASGDTDCGSTPSYTATADDCHTLNHIDVDGGNVGGSPYTFAALAGNHTITAVYDIIPYTITITQATGGTIALASGNTDCGSTPGYTATADDCHTLNHIDVDGGNVGGSPYTFAALSGNHTITAVYDIIPYTITITQATGGTIALASGNTDCGSTPSYTATADDCHTLNHIDVDGGNVGGSPYTFAALSGNHTITAVYDLIQYTITYAAGTGGSISGSTSQTIDCGTSTTSVSANPDGCHTFVDWSDGNTNATRTDVAAANVTYTANFLAIQYTITYAAGTGGSISGTTSQTIDCGTSTTSVTATPDGCHTFVDWSDGNTNATRTDVASADVTYTANFQAIPYTITYVAGTGGSITGPGTTSQTIDCGTSTVSVTATPDACHTFTGWSDGNTNATRTDIASANATYTANFTAIQYTITYVAGTGGSITGPGTTSQTINCGTSTVSVTATPDACHTFVDWSDGNTNATRTDVASANATYTANFTAIQYTITYVAGTGGSITGPGTTSQTINCGTSTVSVMATPDACHTFTDWSDGNTNATRTDVASANATYTANFTAIQYTITYVAGTGGSITGPGTTSQTIDCGTSTVSVTATPDACHTFTDWSDGNTNPTRTDVASANATYTANFTAIQYTITYVAGTGGSITGPGTTSQTINCGTSTVSVTATPDACHTFTDWSDGNTNATRTDVVSANATYTANFTAIQYTITYAAGTGGSITGPGTTSQTINCGTSTVSVTATPDACHTFTDWSDGNTNATRTDIASANVTYTANFLAIQYTITYAAGTGGSITGATPQTINCGTSTSSVTATPDACHTFTNWSDGNNNATRTDVASANVTYTANFAAINYTITVTSGANGTITPGTGSVACGTNATYTITAASCYHINTVLVDGNNNPGAVGSGTFTFTNVTATHTISATFAINTPLPAPTVTGISNVCPYVGTGDPLTYTFSSAGATGYTYILPPNVGNITSTANSVTFTIPNGFPGQANKQLKVTATSACGISTQTIFYLLTQAPGTPAPITGNTSVCPIIGTANTYTYSVPQVLGATSYVWTGQLGTTTITYPFGNGINGNTVNISFSAGFTSSSISVVAVNGCGTSSGRGLALVKTNPQQPGLISGSTNVCENLLPGGTPGTYSIVAVTGATSYNWNVTGGATIVSHPNGAGPNDIQVTVSFPANYTSGTITVSATNGCGTGAVRSLSLTKLNPATPGIPDVIQLQDCPSRQYSYTIASAPANATSLNWVIPTAQGASIVSMSPPGPLPTSITVSYPATAINGFVTVQSSSNCGVSNIRSTTVKLAACPEDRPMAKGGTVTTPSETMQVNVFPNPSVTDFKLQVLTAGKELIHVRILDMQGREYKNITVNAYQVTTIGSDLKAGAYMMEVRQGDKLRTTKLLKF